MQATETGVVVRLEEPVWQSIRQDDLRGKLVLLYPTLPDRAPTGGLRPCNWTAHLYVAQTVSNGFGTRPVKDTNTESAGRRAGGSDGGLLQESDIMGRLRGEPREPPADKKPQRQGAAGRADAMGQCMSAGKEEPAD